jgi:hypothetical protein
MQRKVSYNLAKTNTGLNEVIMIIERKNTMYLKEGIAREECRIHEQ